MTNESSEGEAGNSLLVPFGAALLLGVVAFRCLVAISPNPTFDIDPLRDPFPWFGIGPGVSALLSVLLLLGTSIVLLGERLSGRGIDRILLLLALIPVVPIVMHGLTDAADLWRGGDWLAGAICAVGLAHAARAPGLRALILGGLLGVVTLLAVRGGVQLLHEHGETVAAFDANQEALLRSFGWTPGSIQAELYERRLLQPEATGWFGLANIFSAFMAIGFVLTFVVAIRIRDRVTSGVRATLFLVALGLAVLLVVNGSKGAIGAVVLGLVVAFFHLVVPPLRKHDSRVVIVGILAICSLAFVFLVVFVRGILGEVSLGGEVSLLFRWHYMLGAARMIVMQPLFGVGPDGFQSAYLLVKNAWSPEDPTSAHNAVVDWVATLGIFGTAWFFLLALCALRSGRASFLGEHSFSSRLLFIGALVLASFLGMSFEIGTLPPPLLFLRIGAVILAIAVMLAGAIVLERLPGHAVAWCLGGTAATILALSGLDMLFTQPGSVAAAWAFLGAVTVARSKHRQRSDFAIAAVPAIVAAWFFIFAALPQMRVDAALEGAAVPLRSLARIEAAFQTPPPGLLSVSRAQALDEVRAASEGDLDRHGFVAPEWNDLAPGSNDPRVIASALVRSLAPTARRRATDRLGAIWDKYPTNFRPAWASVDQLLLLAGESSPSVAGAVLLEALARTDNLAERAPGPRAAITSAWILDWAAAGQQDPDRAAVVEGFKTALALSPHDPSLWRALGVAAGRAGDPVLEREALEQALLANDRRYLDPLVQFSAGEQAAIEARLDELMSRP